MQAKPQIWPKLTRKNRSIRLLANLESPKNIREIELYLFPGAYRSDSPEVHRGSFFSAGERDELWFMPTFEYYMMQA
jgi:hypothetical protein